MKNLKPGFWAVVISDFTDENEPFKTALKIVSVSKNTVDLETDNGGTITVSKEQVKKALDDRAQADMIAAAISDRHRKSALQILEIINQRDAVIENILNHGDTL